MTIVREVKLLSKAAMIILCLPAALEALPNKPTVNLKSLHSASP